MNGKQVSDLVEGINRAMALGADRVTIEHGSERAGEVHAPLCLVVRVPPDIEWMAPHLRDFFQGMVAKLYLNRHKEPPRKMEGLRFLGLMQGEVAELARQCYEDQSSPNLFLELHDVANFAFLMGLSLRLEQEDAQAKEARLAETWGEPNPPRLVELLRHCRLWPRRRRAQGSSSS